MTTWTGFNSPESGAAIAPHEIPDLLESLLEKSLIQRDENDGRFQMMETVRDYGRALLADRGEAEDARTRHRDGFLALSEDAEPNLQGPEQLSWLDRLESEHDNLRAAMEWSGASDDGLRFCGALWRFWLVRGYLEEGRERCAAALVGNSLQKHSIPRAKALNGAGNLAWNVGDHQSARTLLEEALAINRKLGNRAGEAVNLNSLGITAECRGDYHAARAHYEESLALHQELGDRRWEGIILSNLGNAAMNMSDLSGAQERYDQSLVLHREIGHSAGEAMCLNNLGNVAQHQGDLIAALRYYHDALDLNLELGSRSETAVNLNNLAMVEQLQGDFSAARFHFKQAIALNRELMRRAEIADCLEGLASLSAAGGQSTSAARLWGAAEALREEIGAPILPADRERYDREVAAARCAPPGEGAFVAAWEDGRSMAMEQAIDHALKEPA